MTTPPNPQPAELPVVLRWRLEELEVTIRDAAPEELPGLHQKLLALSAGLASEVAAESQPAVAGEDELARIIVTLTDQIATLERKLSHKEIDYDDYEKFSREYEDRAEQAIRTKYIGRDTADKATKKRYTLKTGLLWDNQDATDGYHQAMSDVRRELGLDGDR